MSTTVRATHAPSAPRPPPGAASPPLFDMWALARLGPGQRQGRRPVGVELDAGEPGRPVEPDLVGLDQLARGGPPVRLFPPPNPPPPPAGAPPPRPRGPRPPAPGRGQLAATRRLPGRLEVAVAHPAARHELDPAGT